MAFTPPMQFPKPPKLTGEESEELKSSEVENPRVAKYTEKYRSWEDQKAKEVSEESANEKRVKRANFLLDLLKAFIGGVSVLIVEHFTDIVRFFQSLLPPAI
ncbi:hypothetical protein [Oscillibacter sp.]|uniref:hypothetical protein n=1 Tax=Oscillibacter sp. TaxID=1945593 RepID=UPI0028A1E0EC|nr:hypothetical protein [Oscillibacter sp.]